MEQCFLCGKPALKMVEIQVGSSTTSIRHHDHHRDHGRLDHGHLDHGTTNHYALKPLCADCIKRREEEALEAAKALGKAGELLINGMGAGLKLMALIGCLGPLVVGAVGGALFYFFGRH